CDDAVRADLERSEADTGLDAASDALEVAAQDVLGVVLGEHEREVPALLGAEIRPANVGAVHGGGPAPEPHAPGERLVEHADLIEDLERAGRHAERLAEVDRLLLRLDEKIVDPATLQLASEQQPDRAASDHQHVRGWLHGGSSAAERHRRQPAASWRSNAAYP